MRNMKILSAILTIALVFGMTACDDGGGPSGGGGGGDGKSWKAVPNSPFKTMTEDSLGESIYAIAYGNGIFVAGGFGEAKGADNKYNFYGKIATSSDGITWTEQTSQPFYMDNSGIAISPIAYGNGIFIAVGGMASGGQVTQQNKMAYSYDGITWTAVADTALNDSGWINVVYGNGKFIAFTNEGGSKNYRMVYSSDGATWTAITNGPFNDSLATGFEIENIAYANSKFFAWRGGNFFSSTVALSTSSDGVTWTAETETNIANLVFYNISMKAIAYGNGKFVIGGGYGSIATSSDGITWTMVPTANNPFDSWPNNSYTYPHFVISYGNGRFVAGGNSQLATSTDGVTWTADTGWADVTGDILGTSSIIAIAYGNGKFVAGGGRGHMAYWD